MEGVMERIRSESRRGTEHLRGGGDESQRGPDREDEEAGGGLKVEGWRSKTKGGAEKVE